MEWLQWLEHIPINPIVAQDFVISLLIIVGIWVFRYILIQMVHRHFDNAYIHYQWRKYSSYAAVMLAVVVVGPIWIAGLRNVATYFGLLSAGLAIALQGPLVNLAGWIFILWRRPFQVGDRVQLGDHAGDVIDLRLFQFTLLEIGNWVDADQSTGRILHVPNGKVFSDVLANYSRGFQYIWNEIPVLITFESNWEKAKDLLLTIAIRHGSSASEMARRKLKEASRKFMIYYSKLTPTVYTDVKDHGVQLSIRYLCDPRQRRGSSQMIWEDILREFAACSDIDFAYPTQRLYMNTIEGKHGTRHVEHARQNAVNM